MDRCINERSLVRQSINQSIDIDVCELCIAQPRKQKGSGLINT